ncbi:MAG: lipid A export permease/ATP-binding protein MsbA [Deltaproteobacteria bacterium]|nr:lipid A export permease/ATP-binding protein MsbA [Deltaproteobacteria bacterium]
MTARGSDAAPAAPPARGSGATYFRLLRYLRPYVWPWFGGAMVAMLLFSATTGLLPLLVERVFDDIFADRKIAALRLLPVAIVLIFLFRGLTGFAQNYLMDLVGQRIICDLRDELNQHIQRLSLAFFNRTPTGDILSRVSNDVALVRTALTDAVASVMRDATSLIALVVVAFAKDPALALIAFLVFPASVLPIVKLSQRLRRFSKRGQRTLGLLTALLQETVQGNRVVKAFGMEDYERERFQAENRRLYRLYMKASMIKALTTPALEVLAAFAIGGVVWYGGNSVIAGGRSQGSFLAFLTAMFLLYEPFKRLSKSNATIQQGVAGAERVFELLDTAPEVVDRPGARALSAMRRGIVFEHVEFRYGAEPVLRDVDLTLHAGEVVALVGMSGGGKSTLADLIPRFYDVTGGRITIDGVDVRDYTLRSLRAQIAIVTQFTFLFNDTVRANIAYGDPGKSMDEVVAAAKAANAHEFVTALPRGYDTPIGELGVTLSGGQRQRLAIARALLKDAPILILDEATSALDTESERLVQQALERLMVNRTTLVIAHRLSTIRRADRIVVVVRGRIVEEGTHENLLALGAEYRKLHDLQFQDPPSAAPDPDRLLH